MRTPSDVTATPQSCLGRDLTQPSLPPQPLHTGTSSDGGLGAGDTPTPHHTLPVVWPVPHRYTKDRSLVDRAGGSARRGSHGPNDRKNHIHRKSAPGYGSETPPAARWSHRRQNSFLLHAESHTLCHEYENNGDAHHSTQRQS